MTLRHSAIIHTQLVKVCVCGHEYGIIMNIYILSASPDKDMLHIT